MIKIKLNNWQQGRNQNTFRIFLMYTKYFNDIGIQFVEDGSYDFEFIGMHDFINKKIPLQESIEYGLETLSKKSGDYYLFDGSDSTSLMGAYEVFIQSRAKYLFKSAILEREEYATPSAFNKWFFGNGSDLDLSYDISEKIYNRIKLSGWNLGYYNDYVGTIDIHTLDEQENRRYGCRLVEAWPKTIAAQSLGYADNNTYQTIDVTIAYRYWTNLTDESSTPKSLGTRIVERVANTVERRINANIPSVLRRL